MAGAALWRMAAMLSAGALLVVALHTQVRGLKDLHSHQDTNFWIRWELIRRSCTRKVS